MRWTIRRVHVRHSRDGYHLVVTDTTWWALAVSEGYERLMQVLGHPCCGCGIGRVDPVFELAWRLLQATAGIEWRYATELVELPIDDDTAQVLWQGDWDAWQELLSDDDS